MLNACRVINDVLKCTHVSAEAKVLSADDFLPLLILAVMKAMPVRLHSNVEFVATFRHPARLMGEEAYFVTALQSAVAFVQQAGPDAFEVPCEEYERLCQQSLANVHSNQTCAEDSQEEPQTVTSHDLLGLEACTSSQSVLLMGACSPAPDQGASRPESKQHSQRPVQPRQPHQSR
eukprot:773068-Amphidinium_carterae.1